MGTMRGQLLSLLILWQTYIEKRLLMASPYMYKPLVWKRFVDVTVGHFNQRSLQFC